MSTSLFPTYRLLAIVLVLNGLLVPGYGRAAPAISMASGALTTPASTVVDAVPTTADTPELPGSTPLSSMVIPTSSTGTRLVAIDNPYGIAAIWQQGDWVAKSTLVILALMSAASWYVIVVKLTEQSRLRRSARQVKRSFWQQDDIRNASLLIKHGNEFRFIADAGLIAHQQYVGELTRQVDRNTWLSQSIGEAIDVVGERLQGGLAVLATVGSIAPFVGLFGTVWGIYHALTAIGIAGQASIDKVAGPVGEALIMTAIGLAVAVPAVLGYNWLVRRNKTTLADVRGFGTELHTVLLGGKSAVRLGGH